MFVCPGLDDTQDAICDNLVETEQTLCHDCSLEQRDILARITAARKEKQAERDRKEVVCDWARLKPMYRVALPVVILLLAPFLLLLEAARPFLDPS